MSLQVQFRNMTVLMHVSWDTCFSEVENWDSMIGKLVWLLVSSCSFVQQWLIILVYSQRLYEIGGVVVWRCEIRLCDFAFWKCLTKIWCFETTLKNIGSCKQLSWKDLLVISLTPSMSVTTPWDTQKFCRQPSLADGKNFSNLFPLWVVVFRPGWSFVNMCHFWSSKELEGSFM